jgi:hypothetical protein
MRGISLLLVTALSGVELTNAASFTSSVFATGSAVGGTAPDSITYGNGSIWVEYGNGAASDGSSGSSTIVQYSTNGSIVNTYTVGGSVDGLKYNPGTGMIWALQNQDANSTLTIINPITTTRTIYTYGAIYTSFSGRGFDDVAFLGGKTFLSFTNPTAPTDPVLVELGSLSTSSPLVTTSIMTGAGLLLTDPDSLKTTPTGGLIQTGEADGALTFITDPGMAGQTAKSLQLKAGPGLTIGSPDDAIYPTATSGTFYLTDTSANTVYALAATGLSTTTLYVNVGNVFGSVNTSTGVVTPLFSGSGLHGIEFVPAVPEPSTCAFVFAGLAGIFWTVRKRRK